ncbi:unnamed protein product [Protopolystoma xenopodis]|uniref:Uncharacterized protein n=1 Tax=Protopolystoma xenopodis TaxID=117903 RepID=A0A3S5FF22_9PLAT|nr:unnamed protein product [Protopolystoma xenopodis]
MVYSHNPQRSLLSSQFRCGHCYRVFSHEFNLFIYNERQMGPRVCNFRPTHLPTVGILQCSQLLLPNEGIESILSPKREAVQANC